MKEIMGFSPKIRYNEFMRTYSLFRTKVRESVLGLVTYPRPKGQGNFKKKL
ncbi:MAG: hypothetical protein WC614_02935 [bacterium]